LGGGRTGSGERLRRSERKLRSQQWEVRSPKQTKKLYGLKVRNELKGEKGGYNVPEKNEGTWEGKKIAASEGGERGVNKKRR